MRRLSVKLRHKTISQFVALLLCFWMSGIVCASSCCPAGIPVLAEKQQQATSEEVQENVSCPMHEQVAERSGENSDAASNSFVPQRQDAPRFDCCPLASFFVNTPQKNGETNISVFVAPAPIKFDFANAFESRKIIKHINYQTVPRTRGDTYLRNCVFLI